jgi:hypothetical protein
MSIDLAPALASSPTYESLGIPQTVVVAKAMDTVELQSAVVNTVAYVEDASVAVIRSWPTAKDGSVAVESQLGVEVFHEFTAHLVDDKYPIDLAKIRQAKWASVDGLVSVISDTYASIKVKKVSVRP